MEKTTIKQLNRDQFFTLNPVEEPKESQVWVRGDYDRSTKKYECSNLVLQHLSHDGKEYIRAYNWVQIKKECIEYGKRKATSQEEIDEWSRTAWARDGNFDNWCYLNDLLPTK